VAADHGGAGDLDDGGDDIAGHEAPQYPLRVPPPSSLLLFSAVFFREAMEAGPGDEPAQTDVDTRTDEDGRGHDAEILYDEVDDVVWILARAQGAEDVSQGFEHAGEGEWEEVVGAVSDCFEEVEDGRQGEEDNR